MVDNPCKDCDISELCDQYNLKKEMECPCPAHRPRKGKKGATKEGK